MREIVQVSNYVLVVAVPSLVRIMPGMVTFLSTIIMHSCTISDHSLEEHFNDTHLVSVMF